MMSRATMQDQSFLGHHQGGGYIRQHPGGSVGAGDSRRPSRLLRMRQDYQRRLIKEKEERAVREKEEKMVNLYQDQQRRNEQRAERLARAANQEEYPNSRLRQPGFMQQQAAVVGLASTNNINNHHQSHPSVRDFFHERHELEEKGGYVPPVSHHFQGNRRGPWQRTGSGGKHSAGVDRANPLAPIQARHTGVSSAPTRQIHIKGGSHSFKQNSSSPDFNSQGSIRPALGALLKKSAPPARRNPSGASSKATAEKLSDFQKWQMEQNITREERLKKLNMRAPPSDRESRDWNRDYEYEDEEEEEEDEGEEGQNAQDEELKRKEEELLEKIAQQQAELDMMRKEREEEEEKERQEAEILRRQQTADRERRRRQQQEEVRRRRQEEAQARKEEEEQQRAAQAHQERQRYEARLDLYDDDDHSAPYSHRGDNPVQPASHRDSNPFREPNSHRGMGNDTAYDRRDSSTTSKYTPKPPTEPPIPRMTRPSHTRQQHRHQQPHIDQQRRSSMPAEQYDDMPAVSGSGADFYAQAVDEEEGNRVRTAPCKVCGRRFAENRLQKHQSACKNAHKKRQTFDPTKMRTVGTDMAKYISQGAHKKDHQVKKKANWRRQHQEFITNIRYAKQMSQMEKHGIALKDLPPPPPSMTNPDLVPCPHCGRSFNEHAAERHIPRCQDLKTRPLPNSRRRR